MANIEPYSEFYLTSYTMADDDPHRAEENPNIVLAAGNICCYDNDLYIGNSIHLDGVIRANAVIWFDTPFRPFDIISKNYTAGSNGKIVIYGPVLKR